MGRPRKSAAELPPWAQRIRALRIAAGLNQQQLADEVGVSQSTVGGWETGKHYVSHDKIGALALALGAEPSEISPAAVNAGMAEQPEGIFAAEEVDALFASATEALIRAIDAAGDGTVSLAFKLRWARRAWRQAGGTETMAADPDRLRLAIADVAHIVQSTSPKKSRGPNR